MSKERASVKDVAELAGVSVGTVGTGSSGGASQSSPPAVNAPHIVQQGETLVTIAQKYYGQYGEQFWRLIGDFNRVNGSLNIGQILRIP